MHTLPHENHVHLPFIHWIKYYLIIRLGVWAMYLVSDTRPHTLVE